AERAEKEGLQYVIFDQTGSNRLATIIQDHINADKRMIHNIETLTDEDIEQNEDYLSLMEKNLEVLDEVID
ncbi:MAG TPA: adhesin, partial [Pseudogracilibacillus sp.]|nr:adhesin [Pseudogracilibacillus sp.]